MEKGKELDALEVSSSREEDGTAFASVEAENASKTLLCLHPMYMSRQDIFVPCRRCALCVKAYKRDWALRLSLESAEQARQNKFSLFCTLTFDDDNCPFELSVDIIQKFFKRLRKCYTLDKFLYFAGAEYGSRSARPHYHIIFLGVSDPLFFEVSVRRSWKKGFISISCLNYNRSAYALNYSLKKMMTKNNQLPSKFYQMSYEDRVNFVSEFAPEYLDKKILFRPEFSLSSKRPAIGKSYCVRKLDELYENMCIHYNGYTFGLPRYFRNLITVKYPDFPEKYQQYCLDNHLKIMEELDLTLYDYYDKIVLSKRIKADEFLFRSRRSTHNGV